jgi:hypothetical protein
MLVNMIPVEYSFSTTSVISDGEYMNGAAVHVLTNRILLLQYLNIPLYLGSKLKLSPLFHRTMALESKQIT